MQGTARIQDGKVAATQAELKRLPDALSFRIARLAAINERAGTQHFRDELGISLSGWRVIGLVAEGDPATTISVRDALVMDRGLLSRVVKELITRGLLLSQHSPTDKRQTQLYLTPDGWALHKKCIAFTKERNAVMTGSLTPHEEAEFSRVLDILIKENAERLRLRSLSND